MVCVIGDDLREKLSILLDPAYTDTSIHSSVEHVSSRDGLDMYRAAAVWVAEGGLEDGLATEALKLMTSLAKRTR